MKHRSRTGCQQCRTRRIKCDETRPFCVNCAKKGIECTYETRFQWIKQDVTPYKPCKTGSGRRKGPISRKRQKEAKERSNRQFKAALRQVFQSEMIELDFEPHDDPVTELNGPGSLTQFKKFVVKKKQPKNSLVEDSNIKLNNPSLPSLLTPPFPETMDALPVNMISVPQKVEITYYPLSELSDHSFFDHFVRYTADTLVPVPYEESPFLRLLPTMAGVNENIRDLLVAFGAVHMVRCKRISSTLDPGDNEKVQELIDRCAIWHSNNFPGFGSDADDSSSETHLVSSTLLALIEAERGNATQWCYYAKFAVDLINSRPSYTDWDLTSEANSMVFRLIGAMCATGNLSFSRNNQIGFPLWPEWAGSIDFLTGFDLNFLKYFGEAAELLSLQQRLIQENGPYLMKELASINNKALRISLIMNDFWVETYLPDSDVSALCILYQEALKIHIYRRLFNLPRRHMHVQGLIDTMTRRLDRWIPSSSSIQRHMLLILVTIAVESVTPHITSSIMIRIRNSIQMGFRYGTELISIINQIRENYDSMDPHAASYSSLLLI